LLDEMPLLILLRLDRSKFVFLSLLLPAGRFLLGAGCESVGAVDEVGSGFVLEVLSVGVKFCGSGFGLVVSRAGCLSGIEGETVLVSGFGSIDGLVTMGTGGDSIDCGVVLKTGGLTPRAGLVAIDWGFATGTDGVKIGVGLVTICFGVSTGKGGLKLGLGIGAEIGFGADLAVIGVDFNGVLGLVDVDLVDRGLTAMLVSSGCANDFGAGLTGIEIAVGVGLTAVEI
jgi:hypothetical protein